MKLFLVGIFLVSAVSLAAAHPGKTDRWGGHKCWRGCGAWELNYLEYHLHDKDFRPIRVEKGGHPKPVPSPPEIPVVERPPQGETIPLPATPVVAKAEPVRQKLLTLQDDEICSPESLLLLGCLALLLMLLLLVRRVKREV